MKIFISVDMEGLWGVTSGLQLQRGNIDYERTRKLMTEEVNIVVKALFEEGAKEILINDSHATMDNLLIEELDERVSLITGSQKPLSMMQGIKQDFDGAIFIGYHPRALTEKGIFDHTYSGKSIQNVMINGVSLGEFGLNARLAGYYGVPVLFASGDNVFCEQVREEAGRIETLAVKKTISRYSAESIPKKSLIFGYNKAIKKALSTKGTLVREKSPMTCKVTFKESVMMEDVLWLEGIKKLSHNEIAFESEDYEQMYRKFLAVLKLAR